ncbi:hypothetical protein [Mesorhizobium sp.]|uniref:hypothetical protein n=1 Tax=Mesorhizobium sp. TaxID=1871066 RepID=UPI003452AFD9
MIKVIHPVAGTVAMLTIASLWLSTVLSEMFASQVAIAAVKMAVPWSFLLLVPALAAAGGSGFAAAKGRQAGLIGAKIKRMPWIAANGLLVLIPPHSSSHPRREPASSTPASTPCRRSNWPPARRTSRYSASTCATGSK